MLLDTKIVIHPLNDRKILKTMTRNGQLSTILNTGETILFTKNDQVNLQDCNEEMHIALANMIDSLPEDVVNKVFIRVKDTQNEQ